MGKDLRISGPIRKEEQDPLKIHTYGTWADISVAYKLDDSLIAAVQKAVSGGMSMQAIAGVLGISYESLRRWRLVGEEAHKMWYADENQLEDLDPTYFPLHVRPYIALYQAFQKGYGQAQERWLAQIDKAAEQDGQWQAAAWRLERAFPDKFGKRINVQNDTPNILITADDLRAAQDEVQKWQSERMMTVEGSARVVEDDDGTDGDTS